MKPIRSSAVFAIAGLMAIFAMAGPIGELDLAAAAAGPAVATAPVHASAGSTIRPSRANGPAFDINCPHLGTRFYVYHRDPGSCGHETDFSCSPGNEHSISAPDSVWNNCQTDVILYSNPDESGSLLCIDPGTGTDLLDAWQSFQVVSGSSCTLSARVR